MEDGSCLENKSKNEMKRKTKEEKMTTKHDM